MKLTMEPKVEVVSVGRGKVTLQVSLGGVSAEGAPNIAHLNAECVTRDPIVFRAGDTLTLPVVWDVDL